MNKQLGQVKFQINAKIENKLEDIKIVRDKGIVKVKGKVVVEADDNGTVQYKDNAIEALVRGEVDDYMASWLSKIGRE